MEEAEVGFGELEKAWESQRAAVNAPSSQRKAARLQPTVRTPAANTSMVNALAAAESAKQAAVHTQQQLQQVP